MNTHDPEDVAFGAGALARIALPHDVAPELLQIVFH
jgi:hypothetical protein